MIVTTTPQHVDQLEARGLLEEDKLNSNLRLSVERSPRTWSLLSYPGDVVAIFGVVPWTKSPHIGWPWMLAAHDVARAGPEILANSRKYLAEMGDGFEYLSSFVRADRRSSIRWMTLMRFQFIDYIDQSGVPYLQTFKIVS